MWKPWEAAQAPQDSVGLLKPWHLFWCLSCCLASKTCPEPQPEENLCQPKLVCLKSEVQRISEYLRGSFGIGAVPWPISKLWSTFGSSAVHLEQEASYFGGLSDIVRGVPASPLTHFYQSRNWMLSNHLRKLSVLVAKCYHFHLHPGVLYP